MWGDLEGGHRASRVTRCVCAALLALGVGILAQSQAPAPSAAHAATADPAVDRLGPYDERFLVLQLPEKLSVGRRATVAVEGNANGGDELSVFTDPKGGDCPGSASAQPERATSLISEDTNDGVFRFEEEITPRRSGDRSFCAYVGPSSDQADVQASENRKVIARKLRAAAAQRAVLTALRTHGFARRVVKAVEPECRRRGRNVFACEFSGGFPGYRIKGKGKVRLDSDLSYRFRVKAQGIRLTLTDENEEPRPK